MIGLIGAGVGAIGGILGHSAKKKQERRRIRAKRKRAKHAYSQSVENGRLTNMFLADAQQAQVLDMARNDKNTSAQLADQVAGAKGSLSAGKARGVGAGKTTQRLMASINAKAVQAKHQADSQSRGMINQLNDRKTGTMNTTQMANINKYNEMTTALADKGWVNGSYLSSAVDGAMKGYSMGQSISGMLKAPKQLKGSIAGTEGDLITQQQINAGKRSIIGNEDYILRDPNSYRYDATQTPMFGNPMLPLRTIENRKTGGNLFGANM